jgi:hypothetical protein
MKIKKVLLLAVVPFFLFSCGGDETSVTRNDEVVADSSNDEDDEDVDRREVMLPSPLQIGLVLNKAGLEYADGVTHDINRASDYAMKSSKWLNFGVYSADLAYAVINQRSQESLDYMKVVKKIGEDIGLQSIFNSEQLIVSFENNMKNRDSLVFIIASIQEDIEEYGDLNEMQNERVLSFTGAWVEFLHIGFQVADENTNYTNRLLEQMVVLDNLVLGFDYMDDKDELLENVASGLSSLRDLINSQLGEDDDIMEVEFSEELIEQIKSKVSELREIIIA